MNQYTELVRYLKAHLDKIELVNLVTHGDTETIDLKVEGIFPLAHIDIDTGSLTNGNTVDFTVAIEVLNKRIIYKEDEDNERLFPETNEVDSYNECLAIINTLWNKLYIDFERNNISASENPTLEKITGATKHILDGWAVEFNIKMPNQTLRMTE